MREVSSSFVDVTKLGKLAGRIGFSGRDDPMFTLRLKVYIIYFFLFTAPAAMVYVCCYTERKYMNAGIVLVSSFVANIVLQQLPNMMR